MSVVEDKDYENICNLSNFQINSKSFFLTYPQFPIDEKTFFFKLKDVIDIHKKEIVMCVCSSEDHKESDGKHIHTYFELNEKLRTRDNKIFDILYEGVNYHPNIQKPKDKIGVIKYVVGLTKKKQKDEKHIYQYNFNYEEYLKKRNIHKKYIYEKLINKEMSLIEAVDVHPLLIKNYKTIKLNLQNYWADKSDDKFFSRICFWIYGPPGIGKSYSIRKNYPKLFLKSCNKWWDGYIDQSVVLIDDFDSNLLSHYIKIWADVFEFIGEVKGGIVTCKYKILFVTSNYLIDDIFYDSKDIKSSMLCNAISRRFQIINALDYIGDNGFFFLPDFCQHLINI